MTLTVFRISKTTFLNIIFHLKLASNVAPKYFAELTCLTNSSSVSISNHLVSFWFVELKKKNNKCAFKDLKC